MQPEALQIIKDEHSSIAAVLSTLRILLREIRSGAAPNFPVLKAILDYIVSYPDRWHHPKEDQYLFAAVRMHAPEAERLVAKLEREHALGYPMIQMMQQQLLCFQAGDSDGSEFVDTATRYIDFEYAHLRVEEDELMPIALKVLTSEEWAAIAVAFRENDDPLFGIRPKEEAEQLYQRILALAPPPLGLGASTD